MAYFVCYLLIGLLLVIFKTPVRELVDKEIRKMHIHCLVDGEEVPTKKIILFRIIVSAVLVLIYPHILYVELKDRSNRQKAIMWFTRLKNKMRKRTTIETSPCIKPIAHSSWLQNTVISARDAEAKHMVSIDGTGVPFGYIINEWRALLDKMQEGDKLYEFRSSDQSWEFLAGREGIALVRDGKIVADILTSMN